MDIKNKIQHFQHLLAPSQTKLIAVSKKKPLENVISAFKAGQLDFGESQVQDLLKKNEQLPTDIREKVRWHLIGHLQRNKVKSVLPYVYLIHSVDSLRLFLEINKYAQLLNKKIQVLLQIHIADEQQKFGFSYDALKIFLKEKSLTSCTHIEVIGLMGIATNTSDIQQIEKEYEGLYHLFQKLKKSKLPSIFDMRVLSIGMSGDFEIALKYNPTYVRIGSSIFGSRTY